MTDFLRLVLEVIQFAWPFRIVRQWQRGGYYVVGRWWREVPPGVYPIVPFFTELREESVVPAIVSTGRQDVTLSDGTVLSFSASATVRVFDINLAINSVDSYTETTQELIAAILAEKLADVDAVRVTPDKRPRLLSDLRRWVDAESRVFGVEVTKLRFNTFVTNVPIMRLLQDSGSGLTW